MADTVKPPYRTIWTPEMDDYIRSQMDKSTYEQIGRHLGLSKNAVCGRVKRLGLCRTTIVRDGKIHYDAARPSVAPITLPKIRTRYDLDPDT